MDNDNMNNVSPGEEQPGRGLAIASLVLGIVSLVFIIFFPIFGLIAGIVGVILASMARKQGYRGGMQTGGFVCSLIGLVVNGAFMLACVACAGLIGAGAGAGSLGK